MYIVAIAWLYVVVLMAFTESSITAGVLTFFFFGFAPCLLLLWLFGGPARKRHKLMRAHQAAKAKLETQSVADDNVHQHDGADTQTDQRKLGE
jgi:hypothetical protein